MAMAVTEIGSAVTVLVQTADRAGEPVPSPVRDAAPALLVWALALRQPPTTDRSHGERR
jgi:hypothetical protein